MPEEKNLEEELDLLNKLFAIRKRQKDAELDPIPESMSTSASFKEKLNAHIEINNHE